LCSYHHDLVDRQENSYSVEILKEWKREHEKWVHNTLEKAMPAITSLELEMITRGLLDSNINPVSDDYTVIPPDKKMERNRLTSKTREFIVMGIAGSKKVKAYIDNIVLLHPDFPERLTATLKTRYNMLKEDDIEGDELFMSLWNFITKDYSNLKYSAIALAILGYFFESCEVFEK